jgi:hypothetical protein
MFNAQVSHHSELAPAAPVRRISQRGFWLLFIVEGLIVVGMLLFVLSLLLPAKAPLAQTADFATVRSAIQAHLSGAVQDPLVTVAPGVQARSSQVGGFALNGYTYYYYEEGQPSYDPLSRNQVSRAQVEMVSREPFNSSTIVIYRVISKDRATD